MNDYIDILTNVPKEKLDPMKTTPIHVVHRAYGCLRLIRPHYYYYYYYYYYVWSGL